MYCPGVIVWGTKRKAALIHGDGIITVVVNKLSRGSELTARQGKLRLVKLSFRIGHVKTGIAALNNHVWAAKFHMPNNINRTIITIKPRGVTGDRLISLPQFYIAL